MTHDIEDLLNLIKELEYRIIRMEQLLIDPGKTQYFPPNHPGCNFDDSWYWEHG